MTYVKPYFAAIAVLCVFGVGCGRAVQELARAATTDPVSKPVLVDASPAEAKAWGAALLAAAARGNATEIDTMMDWGTLIRRSAQGLRASDQMLSGVEKGARAAAIGRGIPAQLAEVAKGTSHLRHLGMQKRHGENWEVIRRMVDAGGFEHIAFRLAREPDGKVRAVDTEMMTMGEPTSAIMRRMILPVLANDNESVIARLGGQDALTVKHAKALIEAQKALAAGSPAEAIKMTERLPPAMRKERAVLLLRITAGAGLDEATHLREIEALAKALPNEAVSGVHLIDGYTIAKRYDDALAAVARTERHSVPDPYFDLARASILLLASRLDEAKAAAQRAVDKEPDLIPAHWVLVNIALAAKDFREVTRLLTDMSKRFDLVYQLDQTPEYAEYVASAEYAKLKLALSTR